MRRLAENLFQLSGLPPHVFNVYLLGDVLLDAGTRFARRRILRQLRSHRIVAHALTHAHPDHQGSSHAICEALDVPLWCSEGDADAVETPELIRDRMPKFWLNQHVSWRFGGPGHPVSLRLREGDEVGGFTVLETPGHTRGHLSYWRAADRVLVLGDVLANLNYLTGWPMLREPPRFFSADPALNRRSARRLADLEPVLICFGHGPPLRDTRRFVEFVHGLPEP